MRGDKRSGGIRRWWRRVTFKTICKEKDRKKQKE